MKQTDPAGGIRDRFRAHVRDEVKRVALRQLAEGGPQAVSVNAIAKELGVSGPALYRYFANRDELLTELAADAYHDLAAALARAAGQASRQTTGHAPKPEQAPVPEQASHDRQRQRLRAVAVAYRAWVNAEPYRYRLLFTAPVPGYDAQSDRLVQASQQAMNVLLGILIESEPESAPMPTLSRKLDKQLSQWALSRGLDQVSPGVAVRAIAMWSRLHGLVSLEIGGNYASMGIDADLIFDVEFAALPL